MTVRYEPARLAFCELASALKRESELHTDVFRCLELLLTRYNTQIYENRFIVGGVAERIIGAAFVALGKTTKSLGVHVTRSDISVGDVKLSVKGSFRPNPRDIRLVNVMGDSILATWDEPTIFVISGLGIGYADPALLPNSTRRASDAITLPMRPLKDLWETNPALLYPMNLPYSLNDKASSDIASRIVADEILRYSKKLKPFDTRTHED
ncbi:hypothetical protein BH11PLA1_BH11PLA1_12750 [soil metagenome]